MFVSIYFPIFDGRSFYPTRGALVKRPAWPSLAPEGFAFQRNLGPITPRPLGGIRGWVGESDVCEVKRSVAFQIGERSQRLRKFAPQFARLYSDGAGGVQFSVGVSLGETRWTSFNKQWLDAALTDVLHAKVSSRHTKKPELLHRSGEYISSLYSRGTLKGNRNSASSRGVKAGPPLTFVHFTQLEQFNHLAGATRIYQKTLGDSELRVAIAQSQYSSKTQTPVFYIYTGSRILKDDARRIRMILARMYLELFIFERCLEMLTGRDFDALDDEGKSALTARLALCAKRLTGRDRPPFFEDRRMYAACAAAFSTLHRPGRVDELMNSLSRVSQSRNFNEAILRTLVGQYDEEWGPDHLKMVLARLSAGGVVLMSKYVNLGQAGAIGDGASASNFQQTWNSVGSEINLHEASDQLRKLETAMLAEAASKEQQASTAAVAEAAKAASAGDGPGMLQILAKAGKWSLSVAERIGVTLAAAVIKSVIGL